ncbi:cupin domain-containing protein [Saccharothrix luteola]|uniref:cupin domain-containing protein n=1 Tax=Saccharothrix luteola TaxID=2893018 RepID=UPI001E62AC05|nr:cupin domain-containing protein [Saccharothrix luteola]MCC8242875.1 cupin domain-containing protein [Saccharothrix luteola]
MSSRNLQPVFSIQGQALLTCVNTATAGSRAIGAGVVITPPAGMSEAHKHAEHELVVIVDGWAATFLGEQLEDVSLRGPGDFMYIAAGTPHMAVNLSTETRVLAAEARTDPEFNGDVVPMPELDELISGRVTALREDFASGRLPPWPSTGLAGVPDR